ncbi:MAG: YcjX family protein [Candidatus Brocadiia bacterium]
MKTVCIAVTGLREAGKTVFLTSLVNHLLEGSEETLPALEDEAVTFTARELPPDSDARPFPYYAYLDALRTEEPRWPERTWDVSEFRVHLTLRSLRSRKTSEVALRLVDYPGERLLDLPLLETDYSRWSDLMVREAQSGPKAKLSEQWRRRAQRLADEGPRDDVTDVVDAYRDYLGACRRRGFVYLQPSAMLMDGAGHATGAPPFCPLSADVRERAPDAAQAMAQRYERYVEDHVEPFFEQTARCTRQVVLVDVLRILRQGVHAYNDTRRCLRGILEAYDYAVRRHPLSPLRLMDLFRRRIGRVAFVATKADQCARATRGNLRFLLEELVNPSRRRLVATLPDGRPRITFCAAHRSTEDATRLFDGRQVSCLRGFREDGPEAREGPWFPGEVPPEWPDHGWDPEEEQFNFPAFRPRRLPTRDGAVIEHINLDKVFRYVIEDLIP